MAKSKLKIDEGVIQKCLPQAPPNYSYRVEKFSPLCWRVWLVSHYNWDYACGKEVMSIHSFIKSTGDVMRPKNAQKMSSERVCHISMISDDMCYTVIKPDLSHPLE